MPRVILEPNRPNEEIIEQTVGWERTLKLGNMRRLLIDVERSQAEAVTLEPKSTLVELEGVDEMRLVDVERGGPTYTLVCYSFEWHANNEPPTVGGDLRTGTDQDLITQLANDVQFWDPGTINQFASGLSFVFNHAKPHEALRRIERNVSGEVQFRDRGTVDYLDRLGSDKSGSVELSASAGTIEDRIRITERGRELDGTHIRVLGAHEGEAQKFANLVPAADPTTYENEVTYSSPRWSDSSDTDWDRWENKDLTDQSTLEEEAASLGEEIKESLVEVETATPNGTVEIGDTVQVVKPKSDLDRAMRVHRLVEKAGDRNDTDSAAAVVDHLLLSTRTTARNDTSQDLRSIRQFNTGFQGTSVVIQGGGSRQPVNASNNAEIPFNYPQIEFENEAELQVRGLPYRAYSAGADVQNGTTLSISQTESLGFDTTLQPGESVTISTTVPNDFSEYVLWVEADISWTFNVAVPFEIDLGGAATESVLEANVESNDLGGYTEILSDPNVEAGDTYELEITNESQNDQDIDSFTNLTFYEPDHDHTVTPGIINFANDTPSNVDVLIDGTTVATDIGTGTFETTVDISGDLTQNAWNLIELTSDSLGHIQGTLSIDGYKQIGTQ